MKQKSILSAIMLAAVVSGACAVNSTPQPATVHLNPCTVEYVIAFDVGRRLENADGCNWNGLTDQAEADTIQAEVASTHPAGGELVGYKVTNAEGGRVIGVITKGMLLPSGSTVDLATGTRLLGEGDLLVRVGSSAINTASTIEDIAAHIDVVIPFIESSDMMLPEGAERTKPIWTASNGNARWGVFGDEVDISDLSPDAKVDLFANLKVELVDETGKSLQNSSMRNNPLQSVFDVLEDMQRRGGIKLEKGDLISLGNFGRPRFPQPGASLTAIFHGLAEPAPRVEAHYR